MKFPVNSLLAGNSAFRDGFARDCLLQRGVSCEPDFRGAFLDAAHHVLCQRLRLARRDDLAKGDSLAVAAGCGAGWSRP